MKRLAVCAIVAALLAAVPLPVIAEHVLPYPSFMPGSKLYRITRILDRIREPLYFGSIGRFKYHLLLSDKYLVEAKTLFEYRQYLLGVDALRRSDAQFRDIAPAIHSGEGEGKDMSGFVTEFVDASQAHESILDALSLAVPTSVVWSPEHGEQTMLPLSDIIRQSRDIRRESIAPYITRL